MVASFLQYLTLAIIFADLCLLLFYLKRTATVYRKEKVAVGLLFLAFFSTRVLISIVQGWGILHYPEREMLSDTVALGGIFVGFFGIMLLENYRASLYDVKRLIIGAILGTVTATFIFLSRSEKVGTALKEEFPFFIQVSVPLFFIFVAITIYRITKEMDAYATAKQQASLKKIRTFFMVNYLGVPLYIMFALIRTTTLDDPLPELNNTNFVFFSIIPNTIYLITDTLWYFAFIKHGTLSFLQIQNVDWVVLTNRNGVAIYEYTPLKEGYFEENLLSGALFAISSILKETAKITGDLKMIQIGEYKIIIRHGNGLSTIVFTKRPTKYLNQAAEMILQKLSFIIDPESINVDVFAIDSIIKSVLYGNN